LKTFVVNKMESTRVPFLRGILTRSLLDAGLQFEDAFELATTVRDELSDRTEISSGELTPRVLSLLAGIGDEETMDQYRLPAAAPARIQVNNRSGTVSAFSRGRHARFLQSSGMRAEKAEQTTALIYDQLLATGVSSITTFELGYLTYLCLLQEVSKRAAKRYLVWSEFQRSGRPLLLLICGSVGTGKRRMMLPKRLLPVLHTSSFNAWKTLPIQDKKERGKEQLVAEGYRSQVDLLAVPCEAVLQRAVEENVSLILEGVHVHPDLLSRVPSKSNAISLHVTLAVLKSKDLKSRLRGRGAEVPQRRAKRYLNKFDSIWHLQSFLLSEADRCDVVIITNDDKEIAVQQLIQHVNYELTRHFDGSPEIVFGGVVDELSERVDHVAWHELIPSLSR
jgi:2-phosphoglycerate kinase